VLFSNNSHKSVNKSFSNYFAYDIYINITIFNHLFTQTIYLKKKKNDAKSVGEVKLGNTQTKCYDKSLFVKVGFDKFYVLKLNK
jgi:hypothetical protein